MSAECAVGDSPKRIPGCACSGPDKYSAHLFTAAPLPPGRTAGGSSPPQRRMMNRFHLCPHWAGVAGVLLVSVSASAQSPQRKTAPPPPSVAIVTLAPSYRMAGDTVRVTRVAPGQLQLRLGGSLPAIVTVTDSAARAFVGDVRAYLARKRLADDCETGETPDPSDVAPRLLGQAAKGGSVTGLSLRCDPPGPDSGPRTPATFTVVAHLVAPDDDGAMSHDLKLYVSVAALKSFVTTVQRLAAAQ